MNTIKIAIVDDHPLIIQGLKLLFSFYPHITIVGEAGNGEEALTLMEQVDCDILLLDINMPVLTGIETVKRLKPLHPDLKIILLTVENDLTTLKEAIDLHVDGYILKGTAETTLISAIDHVFNGQHYIDQPLMKHVFNIVQGAVPEPSETELVLPELFSELSSRDLQILYYLSEGFSNKEIGEKIFLSEKTVRNRLTTIFKLLNVKDRMQATLLALEHDIEKLMKQIKSDISSL